MSQVQQLLGLDRPPIAVSFLQSPPDGLLPYNAGPVPAGCTFWRKAMDGDAFYTVPQDHFNCAVGSHTHHIPLPQNRAHELQQTVGFMVSSGYIEMQEVPSIPTLKDSPNIVAYAPLDRANFTPDVVVVAAKPAAAMLLYEAAVRAGAATALTNVLGRPGCAALPLTQQSGTAALSFGCKGNRTFTGLPDDELYFFVPGSKWNQVAQALEAIVAANQAMARYYEGKLVSLGS